MIYRFDGFELDPATRELRRYGELIALPARAFECLAYLLQHRDRAVGRDELIAAVWGRTEISDALLSHTVVRIRRTLEDTGNEQRTIRTVPRFGYRWVGPIDATPAPAVVPVQAAPAMADVPQTHAPSADSHIAADGEPVIGLAAPPAPVLTDVAVAAAPATAARGLSGRVPSRRVFALLAIAVLAALVVLAPRWHPPARGADDARNGTSATAEIPPLVAPALVFPAEVSASGDWRWLRLGLMDLIANRLRDGALYTMASEGVVSLLKQRNLAADADLLHDARFADVAALRVLPQVRQVAQRWHVRLDAFGAQTELSVEAEADDAVEAARQATDQLLRKLGRKINVIGMAPSTPAVEELMQRSGAAMLADQLDQARELIRAAPPELQQQPRIEQRMAQIELRAGDYAATERRLHALLDRLPAQVDPALRARALITLATAYVRRNQPERAGEIYEEAIRLRQDQADPVVLGIAYLGRGIVLAQKGEYDVASTELSRARTELATVGDGQGVATVDVNLGEFQAMRHRPAEALPLLKNAAAEFAQLGAREGLAHALERQAANERELLDFSAELATTERFWPPEAHTSNQRIRWTLLCARAEALADAGRGDDAQQLIDRLDRESDAEADAVPRARAAALEAQLAWRRGAAATGAERAQAALVPALAGEDPALAGEDPALYARTALDRVQALLQLGQNDAAAFQAEALRHWLAGVADRDWRDTWLHLLDAVQAWQVQRRDAALQAFAAAMAGAIQGNVPQDLVSVALPYIDALVATSQLDTARIVAGRIAAWSDRDARVARVQARLFRALGQDDAAKHAEETAARLSAPPSENAASASR